MNKLHAYPLLLFIVIGLVKCSQPMQPEWVGLEDVGISSIGSSESVLSMKIECFNPNQFPLVLKSANLDISLDNHYLGHTTIDSLIRIPARDTFAIPVKVQLDMKNIVNNALSLALQDSVILKLNGEVKAGRTGLQISRKVHYEGKQPSGLFLK
jgi:LEA14-like dessication related protein